MNHVNAIKNEVNILQVLDHPFIVSVVEVEETVSAFFIIMEYMEGGKLTDIIVQHLTEYQVKYMFYQMVIAVQYLHDNGVIHRDLKADNILLVEDTINPTVKISDFGLSKVLDEESMARTQCGTPYYAAPEVVNANITCYDRKVDIWSLGVILYYMLSAKFPFYATEVHELNKLILKGKFRMDTPVWTGISNEAQDLIRRMLTTSPDHRINLEEIPDHPWIQDDTWLQKTVNDLVYGLSTTFTFNLDETMIQQDTKRRKYSLVDDSD